MTDRVIVWAGQIPLETDVLRSNKFAMTGIAKLAAAVLGTSATVVNGLACVPTSPAGLTVNVNPGEIYSLVSMDATAYSSVAADTTHQILKSGILLDAVNLSCPAPGTAGQSINYLIEAIYQETDTDLTTLPYYNASNPSSAWSGPNNSGTPQATTRKGAVALVAKAGAAATTGSQTTPTPDAGYTGLWVVTVANGQSTITAGNITQYTGAPILPSSLLASIQNGNLSYAVATGTANAHTIALTPALQTRVDGMPIRYKAPAANTGAVTLNDGLGAVQVLGGNHAALQGGEYAPNGDAFVVWNSTVSGGAYILEGCTGGAIQTPPATQTQHAVQFSQLATVQGAFKNLQASVTGTNANVTVSADEIVLENGSNLYVTARNVSLTINSAATGANGLDTGTLAASTWYSKWVIWNGTTVAGLLSLSATAPTMPSGYTHKARVGWIRTDGTANKYPLSYTQYGRSISYKVAAGSNVTALPGIAAGAQGTVGTTLVQVTGMVNIIPTTACKLHAALYATNGSSTQLSPNSNATVPGGPSVWCGAPSGITNQIFATLQLEGQTAWYASNGASNITYAVGWDDNL